MSSIYDDRYRRMIQLLTEARQSKGLTQSRLAEKINELTKGANGANQQINLGQTDISRIEKCQRRLDLIEAIDWLTALYDDRDMVMKELENLYEQTR